MVRASGAAFGTPTRPQPAGSACGRRLSRFLTAFFVVLCSLVTACRVGVPAGPAAAASAHRAWCPHPHAACVALVRARINWARPSDAFARAPTAGLHRQQAGCCPLEPFKRVTSFSSRWSEAPCCSQTPVINRNLPPDPFGTLQSTPHSHAQSLCFTHGEARNAG